MIKRRTFLKKGGTFMLGSLLLQQLRAQSLLSNGMYLDKIGIQLFSIPKLVGQDFAGTMALLANIGYKEIEFFGPYSFSAAEEQQSWKTTASALGLTGSGFFELSVAEVKSILDKNKLTAPSLHTGLLTLKNHMPQLAEAAHQLGSRHVILPSAITPSNLDGYKQQADEFNEIGFQANKLGLHFGYHNHGNGLKELEGMIPFDVVLQRTDPKLVSFQMDIFWTTAGGLDPISYLDKYPGWFRLMHVKDMSKKVSFSGDGGDRKQWIELFPYLTDAGSGVLDIKTIIAHAKESGVEHFIVERDLAPVPEEALQRGYSYLASLQPNA
jgi:sugar phosphate isomerase/epimerase